MMAEKYGKLPTEVAEVRKDEFTRLERYRLNQDILYATEQYKEQNRDMGSADGVGTPGQRKELIQNQIDRSKKDHGSIAAQRDALT